MRATLRSTAFGVAMATFAGAALAQATGSPVGLWKTIDDETKKPAALIRIEETAGTLVGRIEKILTDKPDAVCDKCTDARKNKPVQDMVILTGLKKDGEAWIGGEILDPNNGKLYNAKLKLIEAGLKLELRGYIGIPALGRTQIWIREN